MDFDKCKWNQLYENLKMNRDALGFRVLVESAEDKVRISVSAEEPLRSQVKQLVMDICNMGMRYVDYMPVREVDAADQREYLIRWLSIFERDKITFLNLLVEKGPEAYMEAIEQSRDRLYLSYLLEHTQPCIGKNGLTYKGPAGYSYDGNANAWTKTTKEGIEYRIDMGLNWGQILNIA